MAPAYRIKPLDESTWDAFAAPVEANGGIFGGCWCMGFHAEVDSHTDAAEPNPERTRDQVRAGTTQAALVFDGDDCVGWVSARGMSCDRTSDRAEDGEVQPFTHASEASGSGRLRPPDEYEGLLGCCTDEVSGTGHVVWAVLA